MRRTEREITDYKSMLEVLRRCDCCRLGFVDGDAAYIVPMNFGFEDKDGALTLYFHGATQGKKMSLLPAQRTVSFEADCGHALFEGQSAWQGPAFAFAVALRERIRPCADYGALYGKADVAF